MKTTKFKRVSFNPMRRETLFFGEGGTLVATIGEGYINIEESGEDDSVK
jgi:hypothetical protein